MVINLLISTEPLSVGQGLMVKVIHTTVFKALPQDSSSLSDGQQAAIPAGQSFAVHHYGYADGHVRVELNQPIDRVGDVGYFYEHHVELTKGQEAVKFEAPEAPVIIPGTAQVLITQDTWLKAELTDSSHLNEAQMVRLSAGEHLTILGYACIRGHFQVTLLDEKPGFGKIGYLYWQHVQLTKDGKTVEFDPDALTITLKQDSLFKKRAVNSSNLQGKDKKLLSQASIHGVLGYSPMDDHVKVALSENLPGFGNSGYFYRDHVLVKRGNRAIDLAPSQVELNVPYFSQRDNRNRPWATCNVTSVAMVLYYYGVRPQRSGQQLEDEFYEWCVRRYGTNAQTDNAVLVQLSKGYGFNASFGTNRSWAQIKSRIRRGQPVVVGGYFTHAGHIVCVVGFTPDGYIVNDPWGDALTGYQGRDGRKVFYPNAYMNQMCCPEGDGNIWAHFIARK